MDNEIMSGSAGASSERRHSLSDWLALHELDVETCRRILEVGPQVGGAPVAHERSDPGYDAPTVEIAWSEAAEAVRQLLPAQQDIIDDTFEGAVKVLVDQQADTRKALTLDNGPAAYPTIVFSYRGEPSDHLIIAHEFAHAVQIRASRGKFVPPIIREVCAFLGESALLSHAAHSDAVRHGYLARTWEENNSKYLGVQGERLQAALSRPRAPYRYAWNYPIARHLAIRISDRCPRDWIWTIFEGRRSVHDILRALPSDR